MTRRYDKAWRRLRESVIARQGRTCAACHEPDYRGVWDKPMLFDVVRWGRRRDWAALCRSCRCRLDAPTRIPKALATRRRRRSEGQYPLPLGRMAA